jgi:DNA-binding MarR family transcriptional regulator
MKGRKQPKLVFLLNVAQRAVERWIESNAARSGALSAAQAGTMFFLARNDGALVGDIARSLSIGAAAMTGLADRLEQVGYVVRKRDPEDGRAIRLYQTEEGRIAGQRAEATLKDLNAQLRDGFTNDEMAIVGRWLESLQHKLSVGSTRKHRV